MISKILGGATLLSLIAAGVLAWLLLGAHEKIGTLESEKAALEQSLKVKENARRNRATTDGAVRRMAPADKLDRLR